MTNTPSPKPSTPQRLGGGTTTAVIMAAGLGSRFGSMTETMPKGFIEIDGMPIIALATAEFIINAHTTGSEPEGQWVDIREEDAR